MAEKVIFSEQYGIYCVVYDGQTATELIQQCLENDAVLNTDPDGPDYCVQFRPEVGPELWTKSAIERSVKSSVEASNA